MMMDLKKYLNCYFIFHQKCPLCLENRFDFCNIFGSIISFELWILRDGSHKILRFWKCKRNARCYHKYWISRLCNKSTDEVWHISRMLSFDRFVYDEMFVDLFVMRFPHPFYPGNFWKDFFFWNKKP